MNSFILMNAIEARLYQATRISGRITKEHLREDLPVTGCIIPRIRSGPNGTTDFQMGLNARDLREEKEREYIRIVIERGINLHETEVEVVHHISAHPRTAL